MKSFLFLCPGGKRSPCTGYSRWRKGRNEPTPEVTFEVQSPEGDRVPVSGCFEEGAITFVLTDFLAPCLDNPYFTTTYGVGELLLESIVFGARRVVLGLPGRFPYDGGMGMLEALGVCFLDERGRKLTGIGENLERVAYLDLSSFLKKPKNFQVTLLLQDKEGSPVRGIDHFAHVLSLYTGEFPQDFRKVSGIGMSLGVFWNIEIATRGEAHG